MQKRVENGCNDARQSRIYSYSYNEFAKHYALTDVQAYRYLNRYKAIDFIESQYEVAHTQSFEDIVQSMADYCRRRGGAIQ